ncbi:hypothetical protein OEZ85_004292 [Tetradesmus obliquus]|uniref:Uncharacterized protein n=1 Tax=Tetradesmus obliquus TaxID=3088 RepID=A0ABY8UKM8_TETOB|nr:hypothetical protein OEZ85_004292 [Tetradesmus obliquus]
MDVWCGDVGDAVWVAKAINPCYFETIASGSLLLLGAALAIMQNTSSKAWASQHAAASKAGMLGRETGFLLASSALACMHAAYTLLAWLVLPQLPFHTAHHAALALLWLLVAGCCSRASRRHHAPMVWLRPLLLLALLLYVYSIYSTLVLYLHTQLFPPTYMKSLIWSCMMAAAATTLLLVVEVKQAAGARADGYAALPGDVEAAAAAAASEQGRTWTVLFLDACKYAWPTSPMLQFRVLLCVLLLAVMRVLNLAVPITYKKLVDQLAEATAAPQGMKPSFMKLLKPWELLYLAAIFFQGGAGGGITGFVNNARQWLWIPVSQDAYRRVSLAVFGHVLDLDLSFHLSRKTGEVTKVVDRGTAAIQNVLSTILFSIAPQIVDMLAAATYLAGALEPWVALIVFVTIGSYIPLTIFVTEWRGNFRRDMNKTENARSARVTDALLNWETVKYFTNEPLEQEKYGEAIDGYQSAEYRFLSSLNVLNVVQSGIMFVGISSGVMACTAGVAQGTMTVGDTVLFLTLMAQLYGPLNFFGTYYRVIQQYMIDMENLLQLLDTPGKVVDSPSATDLVLRDGAVEFRDVSFGYEAGLSVLKGVSFNVPGGSTVAFVGATGSGKSTLTRLLFRFFDVSGGAILVDGQDLRSITQASLRAVIGMVPQDCVLFNDTIRYNIRYGRIAASDKEIEEVADAACIHEPITTRFPKGYDTVVGERGLRLSGGEKQRVAFARALLKNPPLLVLDEATSALDTITEKKIQASLAGSRSNRTTFIVAHRLSTIADANLIVVLKEGLVAEMGSHNELLAADGLYAELWSKQAHKQEDAGSSSTSRPGSTVNLQELD